MPPVLVLNPGADAAFSALARRLLDGSTTIAAFERELRQVYPDAVVHRRGLSDESVEVWYVYRDGRWLPSDLRTRVVPT